MNIKCPSCGRECMEVIKTTKEKKDLSYRVNSELNKVAHTMYCCLGCPNPLTHGSITQFVVYINRKQL